MTALLPTLGPPGVFFAPDVVAAPPLGVRMDVCAFVGVAPRGPAWELVADAAYDGDLLAAGRARSVPVAVQSWAEYEELFGGLQGPGLLPWAVAGFFAQGGRRAYVLRVVPAQPQPAPEPTACAVLACDNAVRGAVAGTPDPSAGTDPVHLRARSEGSWGNRLSASLSFTATAITLPTVENGALVLAAGTTLEVGALLRLRPLGGQPVLRTVRGLGSRPGSPGVRVATLDSPVTGGLARAEVVHAQLRIRDADPTHPREEVFAGLGLRAAHPRWLGRVLRDESRLVELAAVTDGSGAARELAAITPAQPTLAPAAAARPTDGSGDGRDRWAEITPQDVLGPVAVAGQARTGSRTDIALDGLDALAALVDPADAAAPAALVVADLYQPYPPPQQVNVSLPPTLAGADFGPCTPTPGLPSAPAPDVDLAGLRLDPTLPAERRQIVALQQQVVAAAEALGLVALLDVPPGLRPSQVLAWRSAFDSSWAAAWHGWLRTPLGTGLAAAPPSGYAAGLIAATERDRGLATGPAQTTLSGVVDVAEGLGAGTSAVDAATVAALHQAGINLALRDRDGVLFTAARTLTSDPAWRQLTARRVVTMVERSVATGLDWAVFEPNGQRLRDRIGIAIGNLLGDLYALGAFAGGTPAESYFVRTGPPTLAAAPGEANLICEIGVAPSEPCEFLVVRVLRADDGTLRTQARS